MDKAPDAFRTISEAAEELGLEQHVLRFWETRFSQIKPLKRGGGRRYYRPDDVEFLRGLKQLLHEQRYTIKGVQKLIKDQGIRVVMAAGRGEVTEVPAQVSAPAIRLVKPVRSLEARVERREPPPPPVIPALVAVAAGASTRERLEAVLADLQAARQHLAAV